MDYSESPAGQQGHSNPFLDEIFSIIRYSGDGAAEKKRRLAMLLAKTQHSVSHTVSEIITSDRTGSKEVVGEITKLTGHSLEELGVLPEHQGKLKRFSGTGSEETKAQWEALLKKVSGEVGGSLEQSARLNFTQELNVTGTTVPATA